MWDTIERSGHSLEKVKANTSRLKALLRDLEDHPRDKALREQADECREDLRVPVLEWYGYTLWACTTTDGLVLMVVKKGYEPLLGASPLPVLCTFMNGTRANLPVLSAAEFPLAEAGPWAHAAEVHGWLAVAVVPDDFED